MPLPGTTGAILKQRAGIGVVVTLTTTPTTVMRRVAPDATLRPVTGIPMKGTMRSSASEVTVRTGAMSPLAIAVVIVTSATEPLRMVIPPLTGTRPTTTRLPQAVVVLAIRSSIRTILCAPELGLLKRATPHPAFHGHSPLVTLFPVTASAERAVP